MPNWSDWRSIQRYLEDEDRRKEIEAAQAAERQKAAEAARQRTVDQLPSTREPQVYRTGSGEPVVQRVAPTPPEPAPIQSTLDEWRSRQFAPAPEPEEEDEPTRAPEDRTLPGELLMPFGQGPSVVSPAQPQVQIAPMSLGAWRAPRTPEQPLSQPPILPGQQPAYEWGAWLGEQARNLVGGIAALQPEAQITEEDIRITPAERQQMTWQDWLMPRETREWITQTPGYRAATEMYAGRETQRQEEAARAETAPEMTPLQRGILGATQAAATGQAGIPQLVGGFLGGLVGKPPAMQQMDEQVAAGLRTVGSYFDYGLTMAFDVPGRLATTEPIGDIGRMYVQPRTQEEARGAPGALGLPNISLQQALSPVGQALNEMTIGNIDTLSQQFNVQPLKVGDFGQRVSSLYQGYLDVDSYIKSLAPAQQQDAEIVWGIYASPDKMRDAVDWFLNREDKLASLRYERDKAMMDGDRLRAAQLGAQYAEMANATTGEVLDRHTNIWAEIAYGVFLDPLELIPLGAGLLGLTSEAAAAARARHLIDIDEGQALTNLSRAAERTRPLIEQFTAGASVDGYYNRVFGAGGGSFGTRLQEATWAWARTPESKANIDMDWLWQGATQVLKDARTKTDAKQILGWWTTPEGRQQMIEGIATNVQNWRWSPGIVGNAEIAQRTHLLDLANEQIRNMRSLQGEGFFNPYDFYSELSGIFYDTARQWHGVPLNKLPFGAKDIEARRLPNGQGVVAYLNDKGEALQRSVEVPYAEALRRVDELRKAVQPGGAINPLRLAADIQRAIMSDVWLALRPANWVRNAASATALLMAEDAYTLLPNSNIMADLANKFGGIMPTPRLAETQIGQRMGRGLGAATEVTSGAIDWIATALTRNKNNRLSRFMRQMYEMPYGATELRLGGLAIPVGEQSLYSRAFYVPFQRTLKNVLDDWSRAELLPELQNLGVPQRMQEQINKLIVRYGAKTNKQDLLTKVGRFLEDNQIRDQFASLSIPDELLSLEGWDHLERMVAEGLPDQFDEIVQHVRAVFDREKPYLARIINAAPPQINPTWTDVEIAYDAGDIVDSLVQTAEAAGRNVDEARRQATDLAQRFVGNQTAAYDAMRNALAGAPNAETAWNIAMDFWQDMYGLRQAARQQVDEAAQAAVRLRTPQAWQTKWDTNLQVWGEHAEQLAETGNRYRELVERFIADPDNFTYQSRFDWREVVRRYVNWDEQEFLRISSLTLGAPREEVREIWEQVIGMNRQFVDNAGARLFEIFKRYPSLENYDLLVLAMRRMDQLGAQAAAELADLRARLLPRDVQRYYIERDARWGHFFRNTIPEWFNGVGRSMALNAARDNARTGLRWIDDFAGGEFELIEPLGNGLWSARRLDDDTIHRFIEPLKAIQEYVEPITKRVIRTRSPIPEVPQEIVNDYLQAIGEGIYRGAETIVQTARQVADQMSPIDAFLRARPSTPALVLPQITWRSAREEMDAWLRSMDSVLDDVDYHAEQTRRRWGLPGPGGQPRTPREAPALPRVQPRIAPQPGITYRPRPGEAPPMMSPVDEAAYAPRVAPEVEGPIVPTDSTLRQMASRSGVATITEQGRRFDRWLVNVINKDLDLKGPDRVRELGQLSDEQRIMAAEVLRVRAMQKGDESARAIAEVLEEQRAALVRQEVRETRRLPGGPVREAGQRPARPLFEEPRLERGMMLQPEPERRGLLLPGPTKGVEPEPPRPPYEPQNLEPRVTGMWRKLGANEAELRVMDDAKGKAYRSHRYTEQAEIVLQRARERMGKDEVNRIVQESRDRAAKVERFEIREPYPAPESMNATHDIQLRVFSTEKGWQDAKRTQVRVLSEDADGFVVRHVDDFKPDIPAYRAEHSLAEIEEVPNWSRGDVKYYVKEEAARELGLHGDGVFSRIDELPEDVKMQRAGYRSLYEVENVPTTSARRASEQGQRPLGRVPADARERVEGARPTRRDGSHADPPSPRPGPAADTGRRAAEPGVGTSGPREPVVPGRGRAGVPEPRPGRAETSEGPVLGPERRGPGVSEPGPTRVVKSTSGRDYVVTEFDSLDDFGGPVSRYQSNLDAIETLKRIEAEGRLATPEEQAVLARYSGFGHSTLANELFQDVEEAVTPAWRGRWSEFRGLVDEAEYRSARASTTNAHYTRPAVVTAMYEGLRRMGMGRLDAIRMLEPGAGVGNFLGLMPDDMASKAQRTAIELDHLSGRILGQLYQNANVYVRGFQEVPLADDYFDLIISNVPFSSVGVIDPAYRGRANRWMTGSLHNYYFVKSIDKVRPGGVVAFITSAFTMDGTTDARRVREYLASQADLVAAVRLPNNAFAKNAGTEVTTDIIFLRKRLPGEESNGIQWIDTRAVTIPDGDPVVINQYFDDHPEMALGNHSRAGTMYAANAYALTPYADRSLEELLAEAMTRLPENIIQPYNRAQDGGPVVRQVRASKGSRRVAEGAIEEFDAGQWKKVSTRGNNDADRVARMKQIAEQAREYLDGQLRNLDDARLNALQEQLNRQYDEFAKQYGSINSTYNRGMMGNDVDGYYAQGLEVQKDKKYVKSDIFSQRLIRPYQMATRADDAQGALAITLFERGRLDLDEVARLTRKSREEAIEELGPAIFRDPNGDWLTADDYLSGNIRDKLRQAEQAAQIDPSYERNVDALRRALPTDVPFADIGIRLGAPYLPADLIGEYGVHLFGEYFRNTKIVYMDSLGEWSIGHIADEVYDSPGQKFTWATDRVAGMDVFDAALNGKPLKVYDRIGSGKETRNVLNRDATNAAARKVQEMHQDFRNWLAADGERATRVMRHYNEAFNSYVPPASRGQNIYLDENGNTRLPGLSRDFNLRPHQADSIWRILRQGNTMLAHEVGAGKSMIMRGAGMELRRLGLARKPMYVMPKSLVPQFGDDFRLEFPGAKILAAGENDFKPANRQRMFSRIANGDWDAVIVSNEQFTGIDVSPERWNAHLQKMIREFEEDLLGMKAAGENVSRRDVKRLEKRIESLQNKFVSQKAEIKRDEIVYFEQLGVDALFVDEAHNFKNLPFSTRREGVSPNNAQRAFDMLVKTDYINDLTGGRNIVFATGTPIDNAIFELWVMMRYLMPRTLEREGLQSFDAWAQTFGEDITRVEMSPAGKLQEKSRFLRYNNIPELSALWQQTADIIRLDDIEVVTRPALKGGRPMDVLTPNNEYIERFQAELEERIENIRSFGWDLRDDNMAKITMDVRMATVDMRLVDETAPDLPDSPINNAVNHILDVYERTSDNRGAQLVFLNLGVPGGARMNLYEDMKAKLIAGGIPVDEVQFIHDHDDKVRKLLLQEAVRKGEVRVLIGSDAKMATGLNVQERLYAVHHVDTPVKPGMVEQRDGRILRQGNTYKEVEIYHYLQEPFDAWLWSLVEGKALGIREMNKRRATARSVEEIDEFVLNAATAKAISTNNPLIMRQIELNREVSELNAARDATINRRVAMQSRLQNLPQEIETYRRNTDRWQAVAERAAANREFDLVVGGTHYPTNNKAAQDALATAISAAPMGARTEIGVYRGLRISASRFADGASISIEGAPAPVQAFMRNGIVSGRGTITNMDRFLNSQAADFAAKNAGQGEELARQLDELQGADLPRFDETRLREVESELRSLNDEMMQREDELTQGMGAPSGLPTQEAAQEPRVQFEPLGKANATIADAWGRNDAKAGARYITDGKAMLDTEKVKPGSQAQARLGNYKIGFPHYTPEEMVGHWARFIERATVDAEFAGIRKGRGGADQIAYFLTADGRVVYADAKRLKGVDMIVGGDSYRVGPDPASPLVAIYRDGEPVAALMGRRLADEAELAVSVEDLEAALRPPSMGLSVMPGLERLLGLDEGVEPWRQIWNQIRGSRRRAGVQATEVGDVAAHNIRTLDEAERTILQNLRQMLEGEENTLSKGARMAAMEAVRNWSRRYDDALAVSTQVGKSVADWAMLNYADRRNIDTILSLMLPYHYFWTRMPSRLAKVALTKPSFVDFYYTVDQNIRRQNEQEFAVQMGYTPARVKGTVPVPGMQGARLGLGNMLSAVLPYSAYTPNPFVDPGEAINDVDRWVLNLQRYAPGIMPGYQLAWDLAHSRGDKWQLGDLAPQARLLGYGGMAMTGKLQAPNLLRLGDEWDYGRVGREIAIMVREGAVSPDLARWAQDLGWQLINQTGPLPEQPEKARAVWEQAVRRNGLNRGVALFSAWLLGLPIYPYSDEENDLRVGASERSRMGYSSKGYVPGDVGNIAGSHEAQQQYDKESGNVLDAWRSYSSLYPGGDYFKRRPGVVEVKAARGKERDAVYDAYNQELEQFFVDNPAASRDEYYAFKDATRQARDEMLEAIDAKYPSAAIEEDFPEPYSYWGYSPDEINEVATDEAFRAAEQKFEDLHPGTYDRGWPSARKRQWVVQMEKYEAAVKQEAVRILSDPDEWRKLVNNAEAATGESEIAAAARRIGEPGTVNRPKTPTEAAARIDDAYKEYQDRFRVQSEIEARERWDKEGAAERRQWERRQQAVNLTFGAEVGQLYANYLALPAGEARRKYKLEHPELRAVSLYTWNPNEYKQLEELFGEGAVMEWALRPAWGESEEAQAARAAYYDSKPRAFLVNAWLYGRPSGDIDDEVTDDATFQYNFGKDFALAREKFGADIWDIVAGYKRGWDKQTKAEYYDRFPQLSDFFDWWYDNLPDRGYSSAYTRSSYSFGRGGYYGGGYSSYQYPNNLNRGTPRQYWAIKPQGLRESLQVQPGGLTAWRAPREGLSAEQIQRMVGPGGFWRPRMPSASS